MAETEQKNFTLLLVDDNPTNLMLVAHIIELDLPEVRVLTARSAREGLELTAREQIDGAFIDVQMPQMSGLDMCRVLRAREATARIPLVLLTAHTASPEMRAEGLEVGAYDFISQPISNVEMLARIKVMLRMCASERRFSQSHSGKELPSADHAQALRWLKGLLISGDGDLKDEDQPLLERLAGELPEPNSRNLERFFGLMATGFPLPWRRTLLKFSLIGHLPLALAQKLSEVSDVEAVSEYLGRHELSLQQTIDNQEFIVVEPRLLELLQERAVQVLSSEERRAVYLTAAEWFRRQDEFARALRCLILAEVYDEVSQLLSQAGFLLLDRHFPTLVAPVLGRIPERVLARCGWMSLFRGILDLRGSGENSDTWLELAYQRFLANGDERGQLLVLAKQVQQTLYFDGNFDAWREKKASLARLADTLLPSLSPFERFKVAYAYGLAELFFNGNLAMVDKVVGDALIDAQQLRLTEPQAELYYLHSLLSLHQGRMIVAHSSLEQGLRLADQGCKELEICLLQVLGCELLHAVGDLDGFLKQQELMAANCSSGLQKRTIIAALLGYYQASLNLARGELRGASEAIDILMLDGVTASHRPMYCRLLQLRGWIRALEGHVEAAEQDMTEALALRQRMGGELTSQENLLLAGVTCYSLGRFDEAAEYLDEALVRSKRFGEERMRAGIYAWQALVCARNGQPAAARQYLAQFAELIRRQQTTSFWGMTAEALEELLRLASELAVEVSLLSLLAVQDSCIDAVQGSRIPLLRVYCLGRFQLQMEGKLFDLSQTGQASRQILAALIVAPDRTISIEQLMGQLWPESSTTKARNSFDAAHSRLRRSLEEVFGKHIRDNYLVLEKGMLSLRHTQIDSLEYAELLLRARHHLQRERFWQAEMRLWKMDEAWQGEFLAGFDLADELVYTREDLTQMRIQQLSLLAQLLCQRQRFELAIPLLQKGLQMEPGQDQLVRQLLQIYRQQQDSRAAAQLLENYRQALHDEDYESDEIAEMIDSLGAQWVALNRNRLRRT